MDPSVSIIFVLRAEALLGKTPTGRYIGPDMISRIKNSLANPDLEDTLFLQCKNCGFVLDEQYFAEGCPNCGCKNDLDVFW